MPKQKTHRASAKRFKRTGSGGLKRFFVKHLWCIQEISNVSKQCLLA